MFRCLHKIGPLTHAWLRGGTSIVRVVFCILLASLAWGQASCPIESQAIEVAKPNKLYLYFPTADDAAFPPTGCTPGTAGCFSSPLSSGAVSPLRAFDITQLTSYTGT